MTPDEIMKLEAGRELDTLIAERVMGWQKSESTNGRLWYEPAGAAYWVDYPDPASNFPAFKPSTDIAAAWLVVEKMRETGHDIDITARTGLQYGCRIAPRGEFNTRNVHFCAEDTAPLAICRAALLAVANV